MAAAFKIQFPSCNPWLTSIVVHLGNSICPLTTVSWTFGLVFTAFIEPNKNDFHTTLHVPHMEIPVVIYESFALFIFVSIVLFRQVFGKVFALLRVKSEGVFLGCSSGMMHIEQLSCYISVFRFSQQ